MTISNEARHYVELALRDKIATMNPEYGVEQVLSAIRALTDGAYINVGSDTLYMAIDLAIKDQQQGNRALVELERGRNALHEAFHIIGELRGTLELSDKLVKIFQVYHNSSGDILGSEYYDAQFKEAIIAYCHSRGVDFDWTPAATNPVD